MDTSDEWGRAGELTLQDYLAIFARRRWLVVSIVLGALVAVTAWNLLAAPTYRSTSVVLLRTANNQQLFPAVPTSLREDFLRPADAEYDYVSSSAFEREALAVTPASTSVTPEVEEEQNRWQPSSRLRFVAESSDPFDARTGALAWAETYVNLRRQSAIDRIEIAILDAEAQIATLEQQKAEILKPLEPLEQALQTETDSDAISRLTTQRLALNDSLEDELLPISLQLREQSQSLARMRIAEGIVSREAVSEKITAEPAIGVQVSPQIARNTALGAVLGVLLAAGAALLAESLHNRIRNGDDLARIAPNIPVLTQVPELGKDRTAHEMSYINGSPYAEAIERLVSALLFQRVGRPGDRIKVLVTSAVPGEGKTTVAANLARRLSLTHLRTIIIDADLRRPKLHSELGLRQTTGLNELLRHGKDLSQHLVAFGPNSNVGVLPAGAPNDQAATLLRHEFRPAIDRLPTNYDVLIVDAPPTLAVTDAEVLIEAVDAVVLVVRADATKTSHIRQAVRQLEGLNAPIAGFALVGVGSDHLGSYHYSYGYTDRETGPQRPRGPAEQAQPASRPTRPKSQPATRSAPSARPKGARPTTASGQSRQAQPSKRSRQSTRPGASNGSDARVQRPAGQARRSNPTGNATKGRPEPTAAAQSKATGSREKPARRTDDDPRPESRRRE